MIIAGNDAAAREEVAALLGKSGRRKPIDLASRLWEAPDVIECDEFAVRFVK